jgi:hypothetical protein
VILPLSSVAASGLLLIRSIHARKSARTLEVKCLPERNKYSTGPRSELAQPRILQIANASQKCAAATDLGRTVPVPSADRADDDGVGVTKRRWKHAGPEWRS